MSEPTERHAAAPGDLPSWASDRLEALHAEQDRVAVELELAQGRKLSGTLVGVRDGVVLLEGDDGTQEIDAADVVAYSAPTPELP